MPLHALKDCLSYIYLQMYCKKNSTFQGFWVTPPPLFIPDIFRIITSRWLSLVYIWGGSVRVSTCGIYNAQIGFESLGLHERTLPCTIWNLTSRWVSLHSLGGLPAMKPRWTHCLKVERQETQVISFSWSGLVKRKPSPVKFGPEGFALHPEVRN